MNDTAIAQIDDAVGRAMALALLTKRLAKHIGDGATPADALAVSLPGLGDTTIELQTLTAQQSAAVSGVLSSALTEAGLPPMLSAMVRAGEKSSGLAAMLDKAAAIYADEAERVVGAAWDLILAAEQDRR